MGGKRWDKDPHKIAVLEEAQNRIKDGEVLSATNLLEILREHQMDYGSLDSLRKRLRSTGVASSEYKGVGLFYAEGTLQEDMAPAQNQIDLDKAQIGKETSEFRQRLLANKKEQESQRHWWERR